MSVLTSDVDAILHNLSDIRQKLKRDIDELMQRLSDTIDEAIDQ